jgi:osmotically-inducible protein OsmY
MDLYTTFPGTDVDVDLGAAVREALDALDFVRASRAEVAVKVENAHITLAGYVQSPMALVEAERAAESVPGVAGVTNLLIDDGSLARQVAEALATDARTRAIAPGYEVTVVFGYLTLIGRFTDEDARAAQAVAEAVPGVRRVTLKTY